jgi:type I restriction-modification system DNA methylase subunit
MKASQLNWITSFIWGIADDVLRDLYVRGNRQQLEADFRAYLDGFSPSV